MRINFNKRIFEGLIVSPEDLYLLDKYSWYYAAANVKDLLQGDID